MLARDSVQQSGVDSKSLLQLKLDYIRLVVGSAFAGTGPAGCTADGGDGDNGAANALPPPTALPGAVPANAAAAGEGADGTHGQAAAARQLQLQQQHLLGLAYDLTGLRGALEATACALSSTTEELRREQAASKALTCQVAEMERRLAGAGASSPLPLPSAVTARPPSRQARGEKAHRPSHDLPAAVSGSGAQQLQGAHRPSGGGTAAGKSSSRPGSGKDQLQHKLLADAPEGHGGTAPSMAHGGRHSKDGKLGDGQEQEQEQEGQQQQHGMPPRGLLACFGAGGSHQVHPL